MAHAHGCNHTILYTKQDFVAEVSRICGGEKLPVVFDSVGKDTFLRSLDCLRPRGLMVTFGQASGPIDPIAPVLLSQKGSLFLTRPFLFFSQPFRPARRSQWPRCLLGPASRSTSSSRLEAAYGD
jgi:NADPH2:quinone reductase